MQFGFGETDIGSGTNGYEQMNMNGQQIRGLLKMGINLCVILLTEVKDAFADNLNPAD